jgi:hypothetical protein
MAARWGTTVVMSGAVLLGVQAAAVAQTISGGPVGISRQQVAAAVRFVPGAGGSVSGDGTNPAAIPRGGMAMVRDVAERFSVGGVIAGWWFSAFSAADVKFRFTRPVRQLSPRPDRGFFGPASAPQATDLGLFLNIVGELNIGFFEGGNVWTVGGGPQIVKLLSEKLAVYGHMQVGILRDFGFTDFMLQPGGGVIFALDNQKFLLTGGIDFPIDFFEGGSQTGRQLGFGVVLPLGAR